MSKFRLAAGERLLRVCRGRVDRLTSRNRWVTVAMGAMAALVAGLAPIVAHSGTNQWTTHGPYGGLVTVLAIDPQTPANLYAAGFSGVFKSSDGGDTWTRSSNGINNPSADALVIDPATPATLYAGLRQGQVVKSTDGAASWSVLANSPSIVTAMAIDPEATGTIYAGQDQNGLQKTTDGGATWNSIGVATLPTFPTFRALIVDPSTSATVYAGESVNGIFKSTDGGATWAAANTGMTGPIFQVLSMAIDPKTPSTLYAVVWTSGNPGLFKSTDSGDTWTSILANGTNLIETVAVDPKTPSTIYVGQFVGTGASALISTNGGATFTPIQSGMPSKTTVDVFAINPVTPTTLYAGTINGVFKTTNSGTAWTQKINGLALTNVTAVAVDPATPTTIYAGTSASGLFKSTDSGGSWASINTGIGSTGNGACVLPQYTAIVIDPVTTTTLYAAAACTQSSGVFKSTDGGAHWTVAATGLPVFGSVSTLAIDPQATSTIYAMTDNGLLFVTSNSGSSWTAVTGFGADYVTSLSLAVLPESALASSNPAVKASASSRAAATATSPGTRTPAGGAAGGTTVLSVTLGSGGLAISADGGETSTTYANFCAEVLSLLAHFGQFDALKIFMTCISPEATFVPGSNPPQLKDSNGATYVFPGSAPPPASVAKKTRAARSAERPAGLNLANPVVIPWSPPEGDNAQAAACSPVSAVVADPLLNNAFYGGAACGVLHAINDGQQIATMNNGLPPNLQINALAITPSGSSLFAGATNGGVYQLTPGAQSPTQLAFLSVNAGTNPTAGVAFDVVVQAAAADLSAQNVASDTTVQLSVASGIGTLGGTTSCQIPAGSNTCTVTGVTYSVADTNVVLTATRTAGDALTPGNSPLFDVIAAETPTQLAITSVNGGASPVVGAAFNVVVAAQAADSSTQNVAAATTVQLSVNTGAGTLGGTTTCIIPAGSSGCTVTGATYSQADTGVVLTATRTAGDSLTPGNSAPFDVVAVAGQPTATTTTATAIGQAGATLNGTVSANGASTAVTFGYGLTNSYGTSVAAAQSPLAGSATNAGVSAIVTGLTCNTVYHFHVVANNGTGGDIDGGDLTFATSACGPPPTTTITGGPTNPSNLSDPQFTFASNQPGSTFQCQLDAGPTYVCSSPTTVHVGSGIHTFAVHAVGPGGNVDPVGASFTWTVQSAANRARPIPALGEWALLLLALLVGSVGALMERERKTAP